MGGGLSRVSCGVTNALRQRQSDGGRRLIAKDALTRRLRASFVPPCCPAIFPQHVLLSGARASKSAVLERKDPPPHPQILWMRHCCWLNVFIYGGWLEAVEAED